MRPVTNRAHQGPGGGPNLLILGLRGSGKSTVGRALANAQGRPFVDLDEQTPRLLGARDVAWAWSRFGQRAFREAEARALDEALEGAGRIVALGGGTPTAPGAAAAIERAASEGRAIVAYLRCRPDVLRARLGAQGAGGARERPSLTGAGMLEEIDEVFAVRDGLYTRLATRVIDAERSVDEVVAAMNGWALWRGD